MQSKNDTRARLRGLQPAQAEQLRRAAGLVQAGDRLMSGQLLYQLSQSAPSHPEVQRWLGIWHFKQGQWPDAAAWLARAADQRTGDFDLLLMLGTAQDHAGDFFAAPVSLRAAAPHAASGAQCLALSQEFDRQGQLEDALVAVQAALHLAPGDAAALLQRSRCHRALGDAAAAAADCRALIARGAFTARAWFMLVDLKTVRLSADELGELEQAAQAAGQPDGDRLLLDFALGKALEDVGRHGDALAALARANAQARAALPWDAAAFSAEVDTLRATFERRPMAVAPPQGGEVIFLVGLPRSGTTLVEQILASHSQVEGASELPYLRIVIDEESRRRAVPFPRWVSTASADDWARLGQRYLALSARWRTARPVSTDKLPDNWLLAGAALAMLPQARFVDCRRDALETCWSCYKQLFGPEQVGFSYDFDSLAAYWRDYDRLCRHWAQLHHERFHVQHYEALVAQPESQIRTLLTACGLPFEAGCLRFHLAQRAIRTPSALQVRQPMLRASTPAARYGDLLEPLRSLLR